MNAFWWYDVNSVAGMARRDYCALLNKLRIQNPRALLTPIQMDFINKIASKS